jgi:hypothetical protein
MGFLIACAGLLALLMFANVAKHRTSGPIAMIGLGLSIPMMVSLLWRSSQYIGWWTVLLFIAASVIAGIHNGLMIKGEKQQVLIDVQPLQVIVALGCAIGCWFFK